MNEYAERRDAHAHAIWLQAALHALAVTAVILGLLYYWFAVADRYVVFLYFHDMGPVVPDTSPFSPVTSSRYWMASPVASGAVMILYTAVNWLMGRLFEQYRPPVWWRVWALSALLLLIGVPLITMTANRPALPPKNATQVILATLAGLALALAPARMAAIRPFDLLWLGSDGWGLAMVLLSLVGLENLDRWLAGGARTGL